MSPDTISLGFLPLDARKVLSLLLRKDWFDINMTQMSWIPFYFILFCFLPVRGSERSNEISEAEKKFEEERRSDFLKEQLEKLLVNPGSSRAAQKAALKKGKGEGKFSVTATSPISPLGFINSNNIQGSTCQTQPSPWPCADGTCSEQGRRKNPGPS